MFRDILQQHQPVVYRTLNNALHRHQVSHCYLFTGPKGSLMPETALWLAQSVICSEKEDEQACEQCIECLQIQNREYADLLWIDGSKATIKIEQINLLQNQFAQTALSRAGRKVFVITDCENMTSKAANSLLKFIEEPSENTLGIFISTQPTRLLPTIVSRCQQVSFRPLSRQSYHDEAVKDGIDDLDAHLIATMAHSEEDIIAIAGDESYRTAVRYFVEFMNLFFEDFANAQMYLQDSGFRISPKAKDPRRSREVFSYFLQIATVFVNDYHNNAVIDDESWTALLNKARERNFNSRNFLETVSETRDALIRSANLALLGDQMLCKLLQGGLTNDQ